MAFPIARVSIPSDLRGMTNGQLPDHLLVKPGWPLRPDARLHRLAAGAFQRLANDIQARFGETITAVSTHDAYRPLHVQEACFRSRYSPTPLAGRKTKTWRGQTWWQKPNTAMAGVPGTSNHGWGMAMDTALVRNGQVVGILANRQMFDWLLQHAHEYGLSWEAQSEPWHLRYHAGDNGPFANTTTAAPAATEEDEVTDEDIERIAQRSAQLAAKLVWEYPLADWIARASDPNASQWSGGLLSGAYSEAHQANHKP